MIREGLLQRILTIFGESVIVHRSCIISDNFVSIIPEFKCNKSYSDVYFTVNLKGIPIIFLKLNYVFYVLQWIDISRENMIYIYMDDSIWGKGVLVCTKERKPPQYVIWPPSLVIVTPWGDSNIKKVGVLVVSLRGVKFRFWSRLGCWGKITNIFSLQGLAKGCTRRKSAIFLTRFIYLIYRGQRTLEPRPD